MATIAADVHHVIDRDEEAAVSDAQRFPVLR